jgi:PKHD-type hydroxylase
MQLKYQYYYFKSVIPPETCQRIIDMGVSRMNSEREKGYKVEAHTHGDLQKSAVAGGSGTPQGEYTKQELKSQGIDLNNTYVRDSNVTWLNDQWLYELVHPLIHEANTKAGWGWQWDYSESFQFTEYKPGGFYSWHKDGASDKIGAYKRYIHGVTPYPLKPDGRLPEKYTTDPNMVGKVRKISMTINLNLPGEYEGGNLKFDYGPHNDGQRFYECEEIRPQGSVIIFPSFIDHTVTPVTSGTRYSLVLWTLGEPWK